MEQTLAVTAPILTRERADDSDRFADDVCCGLTASPKFLLPQYFYDALGSALFSAICELPEYYVTRAEDEILRGKATEIAAAFGPRVHLAALEAVDDQHRSGPRHRSGVKHVRERCRIERGMTSAVGA